MIYFDHNATTPLSAAARTAWLHAVEAYPANPSSPHRMGARAEAALQEARLTLGRILGCDALDIVWTSGASESANTVFHHFVERLAPDATVWVSCIEHPCVLAAARRRFGGRLRLIPVNRAGEVDLEWLQRELGGIRPGVVALMAANNETGVLQPWREALALCRQWNVPFFCDAAQWLGKLPAVGLGECDFVSASAHKFGGPKGVGFLKCPRHGGVEPLIAGGPQEDGRRAGTEDVAGVAAMLAALTEREKALALHEDEPRSGWRSDFEGELLAGLPGTEVLGAQAPRLWNTVSALMPEIDCRRRWVVKLDKLSFAVSTGSACSSGKEAPSHVVTSMGYPPAEAGRVLRFSSGWETPPEAWRKLVEALVSLQS
jgi:cysteine desulfurase